MEFSLYCYQRDDVGGKSSAAKSCIEECCLSFIRHITAEITAKVVIKVQRLTQSQRLRFRSRKKERQKQAFLLGRHLARFICWQFHREEEEEEEEEGRRKEQCDVSMVQDQSFAA